MDRREIEYKAKDALALWDRAVSLYRLHVKTGAGMMQAVYAGMDFTDKLRSLFGNEEWQTPAITALGDTKI